MSYEDYAFDKARDDGVAILQAPRQVTDMSVCEDSIVSYWSLLWWCKTFEAKHYQKSVIEKRIIRYSNLLQAELIRHHLLSRGVKA